ncbi:MAG: phosphoenolpyruvate synthase [Verrucomicrobia bacterium]|nr:phosphoenolpyruvate synthase [Verrucomicrobiota bacterium]NBU10545.1 phosphoenolpyruvate synthase [Pseudomonadota bacterium]NDA65354.1 phosphoenolpyruvate synthase [Verrucomicrobiota bacterium]NDB74179.1 phosphoenolpyruvate synthase [Verrucomicrobiota bacterium]NDD37178.1 phosphoenolpyruvate synthase [Verrucomicrobiota bacterium]
MTAIAPAPRAVHPAPTSTARNPFIKWFRELSIGDIPLVGGKNASLGEMFRELAPKGVKVPDGFAITSDAYRHFLRSTGLDEEISRILRGLDTRDMDNLRDRGQRVRHAILAAHLPADLEAAIVAAYREFGGTSGAPTDVAVRSSATAEDLPDASFAGQQETYLNVQGERALLETCKRCFASLFTDRAISYRTDKGFEHFKIALSIGVQRMVRADLASSGVMFTLDTETGFRDAVLINAAYGLGENVVQGSVNPDEYYVFKPTLKAGFRPVLQKIVGTKEFKMVYDTGGGRMVKNIPVAPSDRVKFAINDDEILQLARWACVIEDHYSAKRGHPTPMDIEWAKDGRTGELFIVQARPETVQSRKAAEDIETFKLKQRGKVLVTGRSVGEKIAAGPVRVIKSAEFINQFKDGEILVTDKTDPDWQPIMKKAAAIVTNRGGRTCHAAIVSRELGVPAIVGTERGTELLTDGQMVTVSCAEGDTGFVYDGKLPFDLARMSVKNLGPPRTKVMMNVGNPEEAFSLSFIPNDGVGLAREEFIITTYIKAHPLALLDYDKQDAAIKAQLDALTAGYVDKPQFFVDKLAQGVAMIAAAFYPKDVILRLSDFKTNEYANLIGGRAYEPNEENPMIGFRGASRYYHPRYQAGFALECKAVKKVREEMGLTNLKVMVPFCRTVEEGRRVQAEMAKHGLVRGENGLELYVMCEIPSNVILADEFADIFDGFSIGSNDLTQLTLGVDRDSEIVAPIFDERNAAVKKLIAQVIAVCRKRGRKIGICGQAPSDYPEFAQFLVEQGINSISLNPDTVLKTTVAILEKERALDSTATMPTSRS